MSTSIRTLLSLGLLMSFVWSASAQTPPTAPPVTPPPASPTIETLTAEQRAEILKAIGDIIDRRMYVTGVDFSKWPEHLAKRQAEIDKAETPRLFVNEINRAFRDFGFSHLRLRTPQSAQSRRDGPVGNGFGLQLDKVDLGLQVKSVTAESPAAKAGIVVGDVIVQCDGKRPESPEVMAGSVDRARLSIQKSSGQVVEVELQRGQFSTARKETLTWVDSETVALRIFTFSKGYDRDNIEKLIAEANDKKAKYLVLDLRSNGGGATDNLRHLLSLLLPADTVVGTFVSKREAQRYAEAHSGVADDPVKIASEATRKYKTSALKVPAFQGKIATLINRGSASASEICAAALNEIANAPLVGTRSAGAVLASVYGRLPYGFELQYPVNDYVTVKGRRLEGSPLAPTIEASVFPTKEKDEALDKAVEKLKSGS